MRRQDDDHGGSTRIARYQVIHQGISASEVLEAHPDAVIQDPASAEPVRSTIGMEPRCILDLCAGRGTKSRLLAKYHPNSRIVAMDFDRACRKTSLSPRPPMRTSKSGHSASWMIFLVKSICSYSTCPAAIPLSSLVDQKRDTDSPWSLWKNWHNASDRSWLIQY